MSPNRLIIGDGKVSKIIRHADDVIISHADCEITSQRSVLAALQGFSGIVINCVAKTNLKWCEENQREAYDVNTLGVTNVLNACATYGQKFVHISTGCIFDGNTRPRSEESILEPAVWYTKTKAWADQFITTHGYENYLILRPRHLISSISHPTNMLTKFMNYDELYCHKEQNSITCIEDFSKIIDHLLKINAVGIYNCTNTGTISPYEIACKVRDRLKPEMRVTCIPYDELLKRVPEKRVNVILSTKKLKDTGYVPRDTFAALEWCLENYE